MGKTNWKKMLEKEFADRGDDFDKMQTTLSLEDLERPFHAGYGCAEGKPFTAWGERYVYFPVVYDGAEWVGSAPRNPCEEATEHVGGQ